MQAGHGGQVVPLCGAELLTGAEFLEATKTGGLEIELIAIELSPRVSAVSL